MLDIALRRVVTFQKLEFSCSDANSVDIFSTRARCTKRYSNNGPQPRGDAGLASNNIFGDLRISMYTSSSFDMVARVFEKFFQVAVSGTKIVHLGK